MPANDSPLVSIIIPVYNRSKLIVETLQSVQQQVYQNWETIIIDDGSTDNSIEVVQSGFGNDPRIILLNRSGSRKGASVCRNIGIQKARGKYIVFLDSDDLLDKNCLSGRVAFFESEEEQDFLVFQSEFFYNIPHDSNILWNVDSSENDLQRFLRTDALWPICGPIYKREVLLKCGGFKEELPFYQDFDLHIRLLLQQYRYKKFLQLQPDVYIRDHTNNSVSNSIAFTSDISILQKRIDFFFLQLKFVRDQKIILTKTQKQTIWNVLYYFCSRFILEHDNRAAYRKNWFKVKKLLSVNLLDHALSYMVPVMTSMQKRHSYFIKMKSIWISLFRSRLADENVIFNSTLKKVSKT